jgi:hypothetical protein
VLQEHKQQHLAFGGQVTQVMLRATEEYNGSTWTTVNPMSTARYVLAGAGTQTLGLAFGGSPTTAATEEWTGAGATVTKTITVS